MAGFGSLAPTAEPDWREAEAQQALALQQADAASAAAAKRSWADTARDALGAPGRIFGALASGPQGAEADQQAMMPETFQNPLVKNVLGGAGEAVASGATLPGDEAYTTAAKRLKEAGVPGIRYLDQGSRAKKAGTRNYVTFDAPRVLKRYALPGAAGATGFGSLAPSQDRE